MAHVFIVNKDTLKVHLEYMFAGTGAKELSCDFLLKKAKIHPVVERLLMEMICDISRLRKGDKVLFYLQATSNNEGTFFGAFEVSSVPFIENNGYLKNELTKDLTFRVLLKPSEIYQYGVSERECLDYLDDIQYPHEMCWSLIYRKLKGNRGCTMITDYEYERIMKKIRTKNDNQPLHFNNYTYDYKTNTIANFDTPKLYDGTKTDIIFYDLLCSKILNKKAYEVYLQAYILQNLEKISPLTDSKTITWIGNEVSCGVRNAKY